MANNNNNVLMLVVIGGAAYLLMTRSAAVAPYTARSTPGGQFGVNIPGYGQYQSGPGGTFLQFDPKLFQGLFGGGTAPAPSQDPWATAPVGYDPCLDDPMGCLPWDVIWEGG